MEFWGVEVESGKPLKVTPEEDSLIHISQASLGECKSKKGETVPLHVRVGNQKLVLGTLLSESIPQLSCDLVFDTEFELSHNWGKGSVHFVGYSTPNIDDGGYDFSDSEEEEEDEQVKAPATITANGNAAKAVVKPKATPEADSDEEGMDVDEDDSDDEEDSEEEKEETPKKKPESSKKRANEAAPKTPVAAKKAKSEVTPKKTEEKKKGGPTAKKGGKTPTTATQSPKSASKVSCGSCKKTFVSDYALESHNKAKHASAAE